MIKTETSERRYTKEQEACKKVLSIFSYQGNANKSHNEIPAHAQQKLKILTAQDAGEIMEQMGLSALPGIRQRIQ